MTFKGYRCSISKYLVTMFQYLDWVPVMQIYERRALAVYLFY
jgi:hypothetical protein